MSALGAELQTDDTGGTRQRIIAASIALFVQRGYKATSLKAIAREVGVSPPALYWHFESKQDLFRASMEHLVESFLESVEARLTSSEPMDLLRELIGAHVRWKLTGWEPAGTYSAAFPFTDLVTALPPRARRKLIAKQRRHVDRLRRILEEGVDRGDFVIEDVRVTAFAMITLCEHVESWYRPTGDLLPEDVARLYGDLALAMVGVGPASSPGDSPAARSPSAAAG